MTKIRSSRSSRVRDRRGQSGPGRASSFRRLGNMRGGGLRVKGGAGLVGLLVLLAAGLFLPGMLGGSGSGGPGASGESAATNGCTTEIEQIVCGAVDDVSVYWERQFPASFQGEFPGTDTVLFSEAVDTGCGRAPADIGPFYCPRDQLVYLDLAVLQDLQVRFGATGDLAAQYIVAHEYGHHVQNVTGISDRVRQAQAASPDATNAFSVAQELQADCFAGNWVRSVADRGLLDSPSEVVEAQRAAAAVGDDRIMEASGLEVDPDQFSHGSAEQRELWFTQGFDSGDPESCRTFNGALAP